LWVVGPDAIRFVDGLVSQDVASMRDREVRRSFLLGPQGKLRALLWLARFSDDVLLLADSGWGERVASDLDHYRIRVKSVVEPNRLPVHELWGGGDLGMGQGEAPSATKEVVVRLGSTDRLVAIGPVPAGDWPEADDESYTRDRVLAGEPVFGIDVDESTIPQETGLVPEAVSFTKGCYLGQELVARIESRGHVNRHLERIELDGGSRPPSGAGVWRGDAEVGVLTSPAAADRGSIGLSLLRREVAHGDMVQVRAGGDAWSGFVRPLRPGSSV
jgi:folate-binding protein YgfZ